MRRPARHADHVADRWTREYGWTLLYLTLVTAVAALLLTFGKAYAVDTAGVVLLVALALIVGGIAAAALYETPPRAGSTIDGPPVGDDATTSDTVVVADTEPDPTPVPPVEPVPPLLFKKLSAELTGEWDARDLRALLGDEMTPPHGVRARR